MATNQTTVTVSVETTYSLPLSFAPITMVAGVDQQEQLLLFRNDIDTIYGSPLTPADYRGLGQVSSSWLTINETNKTITAITIPPGATYTLEDSTVVSVPALQSGETITINRVNISAEPYVSWTTGSRITADQLNLEVAHLLGLIQELKNKVDSAIQRDDYDAVVNPMVEDLDADANKITNLGEPSSAQDAATKSYVDAAIVTAVTSKLGVANGIATLDASGELVASQNPTPITTLPGVFFSRATAPTRTTAGNGLFGWGSLWYNSTNGRLYIYNPDDRYTGLDETYNGEVGYWVDVSSPAQ